METPAEYWERSEASRLAVAKQQRVDLFRRQPAAEPGRVAIHKAQPGLMPQTTAERTRGAASRSMQLHRFLSLLTDYMRAHPNLSRDAATTAVQATTEGADAWEQAGLSGTAPTAAPRPASSALTKRAAAGRRLEVLAAAQGVSVADLIHAAHRAPAKHADVLGALRDYSARDAHKTALELADDARKGMAIVKQQAARQAAGEPADLDEAAKAIAKRDAIAYPAAAQRAALEFPQLYREYQQR